MAMVEVSCGESVELAAKTVSAALVEASAELLVLLTGNDEDLTLVVTAAIAELSLNTAEVVSAGIPMAPWASVLCGSDEVPIDVGTEPLGTVAPEAGEIPPVPGLIVGNAEESPSLVIVELETAKMLSVLVSEVDKEAMYVDVRAAVWAVLLDPGYSVRTKVVVMTLVLVEYVWPPEEAQKKEIVAVVGVLFTTGVVVVAAVDSCKSVKFQPELLKLLKDVLVRVAKLDTVSVRVI